MAIITMTAAAGAPGATTTALGMALAAPPPVLLVEVDPGGSTIIPGYFRHELGFERSILRVAAHSGSAHMAQLLLQETVDLDVARGQQPAGRAPAEVAAGPANGASSGAVPSAWTTVAAAHPGPSAEVAGTDHGVADLGGDRARLLVPGFAHPRLSAAMSGLWPEVADGLRTLSSAGYTIICDLGRATQAGFPMPVFKAGDAVIVVVRNTLASVMRSRPGIEALADQLETTGRRESLIVGVVDEIPGGGGYTPDVIAHAFRAATVTIAWEPAAAAVLSDGAREPRRRGQSTRLLTSYRSAATTTLHRIEQRRRQLGESR